MNGQEVNRDDYPNLWEWVQQQVGFLVEEGEWQSISSAHNGNVGKYSVGNGTSTFRLPNLGCWVRGGGEAGTANGVGGNLDAGLPNITGSVGSDGEAATNGGFAGYSWNLNEGALYGELNKTGLVLEPGTYTSVRTIHIDASRANSIYGNAETVQPESIVGIWLVKAYHVPVDNMGNTITVNGVPPDESGDITIEVPQPTIATEAEAEAGTNNAKFMTPLRTKQAINVLMNAIPVGTILPFAGNRIPSGFLACNGAAVSRTTYSALFSAIGTTYGGGDGSSTFNVPQLEDNRFLEFHSTRGVKKNAGLPNITGQIGTGSNSALFYAKEIKGAFVNLGSTNLDYGASGTSNTNDRAATVKFDASRSNGLYGDSNTVQPESLTVRAIIKY